MARHIEDEVKYYYDSHATEKDRMGQPSAHAELVRYLWNVLKCLFHEQSCTIYKNLNFYQTSDPFEYPEEPDLAIIKGVAQQPARSWRVGKRGPAPHVVFEIGSEETWNKDLTEKPDKYARMGVQEYFAYDPNDPPLARRANQRLFGWHLDADGRHMTAMQPLSNGSLWSPYLDSWLVPDGTMLRLYDTQGHMRLTFGEAEAQLRQAEAQRADAAVQQAEFEAMRAQAEARRSQVYAEKLRSMGIDPEQLI